MNIKLSKGLFALIWIGVTDKYWMNWYGKNSLRRWIYGKFKSNCFDYYWGDWVSDKKPESDDNGVEN